MTAEIFTVNNETLLKEVESYIKDNEGHFFKPREFLTQENHLHKLTVVNEALEREFCNIVNRSGMCQKCVHARLPSSYPPPRFCKTYTCVSLQELNAKHVNKGVIASAQITGELTQKALPHIIKVECPVCEKNIEIDFSEDKRQGACRESIQSDTKRLCRREKTHNQSQNRRLHGLFYSLSP